MHWLSNIQNFLQDRKKVTIAVIVFLVTNSAFGLFILEEGQQQCGFSVFISQSTENWQIIEDVSIPCMKTSIKIGQVYFYLIGWTNPIMAPAYWNYFFVSAPGYLEAAREVSRAKNKGID